MAPLVARPAEPLTEDPFAGGNTIDVPDFDGTRLSDLGATEEEVTTLAEHFEAADRDERRRFAGWLSKATDEGITGWLTQWREFAEQAAAEAALIDGTVDEVLDRVKAAPEDERFDLAERTLAAEDNQGENARSTLTEELGKLITGWREEADAEEARLTELRGLIDGKVDEVLARVGDDQDMAKRTLEAERELAGDKARKTLVAELEAIAARPAPEPPQSDGDGSGGPETPGTPGEAGDGQPGAATGDSDPTS